jgi:putative ABC transport system permease protein
VGHGAEGLYTVVGVVEDRSPIGLGGYGAPPDAVYLSVLQHPAAAVELLVRGARPGAVDRALRRSLGPRAGTVTRVAEARLLEAEAAPLSWFGGMIGGEGWALLFIATVGTFAVMWLWVASLLRELAVRRAVGARRRDVLAFVLARAGLVALAGIAFGTWVGMMLWDALSAAVARLPAWDPRAVAGYGLLLAAATLAGALLPAWRAVRATPARLLGAS